MLFHEEIYRQKIRFCLLIIEEISNLVHLIISEMATRFFIVFFIKYDFFFLFTYIVLLENVVILIICQEKLVFYSSS